MTSNKSQAVWLYGSTACGRADAASDVDILVVDDEARVDASRPLDQLLPHRTSVSTYSWMEMEKMASQGSLFLLHLKLEGRPIFEATSCVGRLETILDALGSYSRAAKDVRSFSLTLQDIRSSLTEGGSAVWELSVLATLVRNASILGCYLLGTPSFGRQDPVRIFGTQVGLCADEINILLSLSAFQLFAVGRGTKPAIPNTDSTKALLCLADRLVKYLEEVDPDEREEVS